MGKSIDKTNAARLLDKAKISYKLLSYEVDESDLTASHLAHTLNQDINRIFKTIVLKGERNGYFVCVLPGNKEINLKLAAKAVSDKKADLIPMKDLLSLTGYIRGGCSPIGMKKNFPIFFHSSVRDYESVFVSAGQRGLQFEINPDDLIRFTGGTVVDLIGNIVENDE